MKGFFKGLIGLSLVGALGISIASGVSANAASYFDAKYYTNPASRAHYYDSVDTSLTGNAFREELYDVISKGYKQHSYSSNNTVLRYTDPDPKHPGNIICFYTGQSMNGGWNKEHVWAKSHGFPEKGYKGSQPYSDAHHLRPTLNSINSSRSSSDFGEVTGGNSDDYGNKWTSNTFEPRDEVKGDVARIMFYMATRYGSKTEFNLQLVEAAHTSGSSLNGKFGGLNTLLKWHYNDPVSKEEIYRNNVIDLNYQHNRNPYIDHPEFVDLAFPSSMGNQEPDQAKVDNVINLINNIPANVTLADKDKVIAAEAFYNQLNYKEQALVTNYDRLVEARKAIDALGGGEKPNPGIYDKKYKSFEELRLQSSINLGYKDEKITRASLRFGITTSNIAVKDASEFGIVAMPKNELGTSPSIKSYFMGKELKESDRAIVTKHKELANKSDSGYQFALVGTGIEEKLGLEVVACGYATINGYTYYTKDLEASFISAAMDFADFLPDEDKNLINSLLKPFVK